MLEQTSPIALGKLKVQEQQLGVDKRDIHKSATKTRGTSWICIFIVFCVIIRDIGLYNCFLYELFRNI